MNCKNRNNGTIVRYGKIFIVLLAVQISFVRAQMAPSISGTMYSTAAPSSMSPDELRQAEQRAKASGIPQSQIDAMKKRYEKSPSTTPEQSTTSFDWGSSASEISDTSTADSSVPTSEVPAIKQTSVVKPGARGDLNFFGYDLFLTTPDAFKPTAVGPIDPGYLVGPGDVLRLAVWGEVEFQYELTVSNDGKILLPVAGQVYVSGIPFDNLQEKIKNLLSRHYSGLAGKPARTFMDLTVARLRPIRIFIMGEVSQPGGYTVSSFSNVFNSLYSVGGPTSKGSLRNVQVFRNDSAIATIDIYEYLLNGRGTSDIRLMNNDLIFVPPRGKSVAITGSVFRPAVYELKETENFQKLLTYSGNIATATNVDRGLLYRVAPFIERKAGFSVNKVIDIDLKKYLDKQNDLSLFDQDSVAISPLSADLKNFAMLNGAVRYPGVYQSENTTLKQIVFDFGKLIDNKSFTKRADLIRLNDDRITTTTTPIDLDRLLAEPSYDRLLSPGDEIIVYEIEVEKPTDLIITVEGEVRSPGVYKLSTGMTALDAIIRGGGFTRAAVTTKLDVFRPDISNRDTITRRITIDFPDSIDFRTSKGVFPLKDRDRVVVRKNPNYTEGSYCMIRGYVSRPGTYALERRNELLTEMLDRAGGLLPDAFLCGATMTRNNKRLVVDFDRAYRMRKKADDVIIQQGDIIDIPSRPNTVTIDGRVNNPGLYSFVKGKNLHRYINMAGGLADSSHYIIVTKPNGESQRFGKFGASRAKVEEGSSIIVTKKPFREKNPNNNGPSIGEIIKDTLAIVTSAVTIIILAGQLK